MKKLLKKLHGIKKIFKRKQEISLKRIVLVSLPFLIALGVYAANTTDIDVVGKASLSESSYLTYDKAVFATVDPEGEIVFHEKKPSFVRGEDIHFALMSVGEFKVDEEGKNWVDIDMSVIGPDKKEVMNKKNLLGDGGHLKLENNIAPSPSGVFVAGTDMKNGKYTINVRVYDRIGGGEVGDSGTFVLE